MAGRWRTFGFVFAAALVLVPAVRAAWGADLKVGPTRVYVGEAVAIEINVYWTYLSGNVPAEGFPRDAGFNVVAIPPTDCFRAIRISVTPTEREWIWRGTFRFSRPGRWTIRMLNLQERANPCLRVASNPGVAVSVLRRGPPQ